MRTYTTYGRILSTSGNVEHCWGAGATQLGVCPRCWGCITCRQRTEFLSWSKTDLPVAVTCVLYFVGMVSRWSELFLPYAFSSSVVANQAAAMQQYVHKQFYLIKKLNLWMKIGKRYNLCRWLDGSAHIARRRVWEARKEAAHAHLHDVRGRTTRLARSRSPLIYRKFRSNEPSLRMPM